MIFFLLVTFLAALALTSAFKPELRTSKVKPLQSTIPRDLPGVLAPTGYFDPFRFSANVSEDTIKRWREAELKHGRVAMLAALGLLIGETWNPLFGGKVLGPAIYHFQQVQTIFPPFWYLSLLGIGIVEGYNIAKVRSLNVKIVPNCLCISS